MRAEARAPAVQVLMDGRALPGVMAADVWSNNYLSADRFRVRLAAASGALDGLLAPGVRLQVRMGVGGDWAELLTGEADGVHFDPVLGVIDCEGRDLAALFIDARVDETFANRTASEIARELAGRHGLSVAGEDTGTLVGRYYQSEHGQLTMGQFAKTMSEWDLLAFLAGREGFRMFVEGTVLRFGRAGATSPVVLRPEHCTSLVLDRQMAMTRAIEVTVRSWDQRGGEVVVQTVQGGGRGRAWKHALVRPNLPPDDALRIAQQTLGDLLRHGWTARATLPGELGITARDQVAIEGTGSEWDRSYAVVEVGRHLDARHGFTQTLCLQGVD